MSRRKHVFGTLMLCGCVVAALAHQLAQPTLTFRRAPASAQFGVPDRPLRFVSYNILHNRRGTHRVLEEIRQIRADFVLLQEVESRDVDDMVKALGMTQAYEGQVYFASHNLAGRSASWGNAILSKHPLYEASSIPNPGGGSFGVWACSVVDGQKFYVASVHLSATWNAKPRHLLDSAWKRNKELANLQNAWKQLGRPPIVIGGDFNQLPMGNNYALMTQHWRDALDSIDRDENTFKAGLLRTRIDYFLTSSEWRTCDGGVVKSEASDHRPIWVQVKSKDVDTR